MKRVTSSGATNPAALRQVLEIGEPAIFRGLVRDWPIVQAALQSHKAVLNYLRQFDRGHSLTTMLAPPELKGRFFYNEDVTGFTFKHGDARLSAALDFLANAAGRSDAPAMAVQSVPVRQNLPGFEEAHPMPLHDEPVEPRIWIGNRAIVAAHHDHSENVACCTAGRRRFTLFPPDQVSNLYQGPFELTPARATISMVDFRNPDREKFPRFDEALAHSLVADLEPGDALYVPYLWWHHVEAFDDVNILVNYWWQPDGKVSGHPRDVLMHAMITIRQLPPAQRAAWKAMFDHYIFEENGPVADYLPPERRGVMGELDDTMIRQLRTALARSLMTKV
ncbi:cupin-like domain-containing protein [Parvularcula dongshanensis]|uniref:JmjC domain-containing protein n=1 Tax=Parvularcula dongshanensis TaxID=1173995 RepID=A0A840I8L0_9PROT|nr:cupin-like domain-containing protein [Parvularcula dongshanensis]MBB4660290.1 hypothetical protein [Parvularcula dongshanensis]